MKRLFAIATLLAFPAFGQAPLPSPFNGQSGGGGGTGCVPGGSAGQLLYGDGLGGCTASANFTITGVTLAGGASAVLDMHSAGTSSVKLPGGFVTGLVHVTTTTGATAGGLLVNADITNTTIDLTTKVTGVLPIANGGTSGATQQAAFDALAPTATVAGSIIYWNGTHWVKLDGNTSGTACLQEDASGVPSFATCGSGASYSAGNGLTLTSTTFSINTTITADLPSAQAFTGVKTFGANKLILMPGADSGTTAGMVNINASNQLDWYDGSNRRIALATTGTPCTSVQAVFGSGTSALTTCVAVTGTGSVVLASAPTISLPVIGDFSNSPHTHADAAGGGALTHALVDSYLVVTQISAPSAPSAGILRVYGKTGAGLCALDSSSTETCTGGSGGGVSSVAQSFTGGLISVAGSPITTSGTLALTVAGTSGGIVYFSSSSAWASSGVLGANLPLFGGGAGSSPIAGTRSGNTTAVVTTTGTQTSGDCVKIDASGNHIANGSACGGSVATLTGIGSAGTAAVQILNTTATVGISNLTIKAGAGQSGNHLMDINDASSNPLFYVQDDGRTDAAAFFVGGDTTRGLYSSASGQIGLWGGGGIGDYAFSVLGGGGTAAFVGSGGKLGFASTTQPGTSAPDTYFTRDGAAKINANGTLALTALIGNVAPTGISGCSATLGTGATNTAGTITSGTTGSCTPVVTFTITAPHGWACGISNQTTANLIRQTASSATTATFSGVTVTSDVISYVCAAY